MACARFRPCCRIEVSRTSTVAQTARERLEAMELEEATSLVALGCTLPSDMLATSGLSVVSDLSSVSLSSVGLSSVSGASRTSVTAHTILVVDCSGSMRNPDVTASSEVSVKITSPYMVCVYAYLRVYVHGVCT